MRSNSNNISSLDLFRGIAGYGVAICHFYYYTYYLNDFQFYSIFFVVHSNQDQIYLYNLLLIEHLVDLYK